MTPHTAHPKPILHDAFIALLEADKLPDAQLVEEIVGEYPEFAAEITDFAVELAIDMLVNSDDDTEVPVLQDEVSPLVSRALSSFQNELFIRDQAQSESDASLKSIAPETNVIDPFAAMDRKSFGEFARSIHANKIFAVKLRDRQIIRDTMPKQFLALVAEKLNNTVEALMTYLDGRDQRPVTGNQFFKADDRPNHDLQQSFDEAVLSSSLDDEQKQFLQSLR